MWRASSWLVPSLVNAIYQRVPLGREIRWPLIPFAVLPPPRPQHAFPQRVGSIEEVSADKVLAAWSEWHGADAQPGYHTMLLAFPSRAEALAWIDGRAGLRSFTWGRRLLEPQVTLLNGKDVGWYMRRTA